MELLDDAHPRTRPPMNQVREVLVRGGTELEEMLPLEVRLTAFAETAATSGVRCAAMVEMALGSRCRGWRAAKRYSFHPPLTRSIRVSGRP